MRYLLLVGAFLFSLFVQSQSSRYSITVKTDDRLSMHGFCYWQEMLVKSADTLFTHRLQHGTQNVIRNLKPGKYELTAISLFNGRISKKVDVKKKNILVKMKGLQAYYKRVEGTVSLSEKLKVNDTLFIVYNSNSDENRKEKIAVTRMKLGYKAIQYVGISSEVFQEMQFKDEFYKQVIKFEQEGKRAHTPKGDAAPKAEIYTLALNREILSFIVPGEWEGLNTLKALLFLVEQK